MLADTEQYIEALETIIRRGLREEHLKMLRAHWAAPRRTVSMSQLARVAGYPKHGNANIQYGSLAKRIARWGEIPLSRVPLALGVIATWPDFHRRPGKHFTFSMREELADALELLGLTNDAVPPPETDDPSDGLEGEGRRRHVVHRRREAALRAAKIQQALARSADGRLRCEVPNCRFDFEAVYGQLGAGYIQVHHLRPLSSRATPERTRLADLAIVCANCHAMIHRHGESRPLTGLVRKSHRSPV